MARICEWTYKHNELNQALATHQDSDGSTLAPQQFAGSCGKRSTDYLAGESASNDADYVRPSNAIAQQAEISI
jgi:hypothetical protein